MVRPRANLPPVRGGGLWHYLGLVIGAPGDSGMAGAPRAGDGPGTAAEQKRESGHQFAGPLTGRARVSIDLFVNGTLMRGLALHSNLEGAAFLEACETAAVYRLYSIDDVHPGMFEVGDGGGRRRRRGVSACLTTSSQRGRPPPSRRTCIAVRSS